jgi:neural Wiskott-Aldrich syndrome protein
MIPPPAMLPEVEEWLDAAYQKKHDRPPLKTVRQDDADSSAPVYEGEAGPSFLHGGAPPPFEERDAPPPFSSHNAESSTSSRLPTFLESEAEIIIPHRDEPPAQPLHAPLEIEGEGVRFGFSSSQQFDGHSEVIPRSSSPPPTLEMAARDTNVTGLADIHETGQAIGALALALEPHDDAVVDGQPLPPPPPAVDDPSDPPPSIDSEFRSPALSQPQLPPHSSSPPPHPSFGQSAESTALPSSAPQSDIRSRSPSHSHAPPPYLTSENGGEQENVARPPPYVD